MLFHNVLLLPLKIGYLFEDYIIFYLFAITLHLLCDIIYLIQY